MAAVLAVGSSAQAQGYGPGYYQGQPPPPPPRGVMRGGFVIGGGIGLGAITFTDCDGCDALGGLALEFHLGGMVAPSLALMADFATVLHPVENDYGDNSTLASNTVMGKLRGWISPIFWIEGGLGVGYMSLSDAYGTVAESEGGFGGLLGAGIEIVQGYQFALDIQLRVTAARYDYGDGVGIANTSLLVGFNWY